jgi:tRNA-specific 2-thiouridylase
MSKPEVREVARDHELDVAEKAESQEICFVPDGNYAGFIDRYLEAENATEKLPGAGEIVNTSGEHIGEHGGIHHYTVGQRRGIGISPAPALRSLD